MKVREAISDWPPSAWMGSYSGLDRLSPNTGTASIKAARIVKEGIELEVLDQGGEFHAVCTAKNEADQEAIAKALNAMVGQGLEATGNAEVE